MGNYKVLKNESESANNFNKHIKERKYVEISENTITFLIQNDVRSKGINGCQVEELGKVWLEILQHFNKDFPCRENSITITKIQEALMWQEKRTQDRVKRGVEGYNKK